MQTFNILTAQNVAVEYQLASLRDRLFALLLDLIIILIFWSGIGLLYGSLSSLRHSILLGEIVFSFPIWFVFVYNIIAETAFNGQTLGKRSLAIRVMRADGAPLQWGDSFMRVIMLFIDFFFSLGAVGALFIVSNERRQRLGDMAAQTIVVKLRNKRESALLDNFNHSDIYTRQAVYPQVVHLREEDIVFTKYAVERYLKYRNAAHSEVIRNLYRKMAILLDIEHQNLSVSESCLFLENLIRDYVVSTR